jgi:hypothetical protein
MRQSTETVLQAARKLASLDVGAMPICARTTELGEAISAA